MREVIQIGDTLKVAVFHFLTRSYATRTNVLSDSSEAVPYFEKYSNLISLIKSGVFAARFPNGRLQEIMLALGGQIPRAWRWNRSIMSGQDPDEAYESDLSVQEAKPELKQPPLYKVLLFNDDYTPMEFVVTVLETFFRMDREQATQIMLHVHTRGVGLCGVYTREIAETKVLQVNDYSRSHQYPLMCTMEEA